MSSKYQFLGGYSGKKVRMSVWMDEDMKDAFLLECGRRDITMSRALDIIITRWTMKKARESNPKTYHKRGYDEGV